MESTILKILNLKLLLNLEVHLLNSPKLNYHSENNILNQARSYVFFYELFNKGKNEDLVKLS